MRDVRRALRAPTSGPRRPRRRRVAALAAAAAVVVAAVVAVGLVVAGELGEDVEQPPPTGVTDVAIYRSVRIGASQLDVRRLLGQPPRRIVRRTDGPEFRECWRYARRSGRPGGFRFCFANGQLVEKGRLSVTPR